MATYALTSSYGGPYAIEGTGLEDWDVEKDG